MARRIFRRRVPVEAQRRVPAEAPTAVIERQPPVVGGPPPLPPEEPRRSQDIWPWLIALVVLVVAGLVALWYFQSHKDKKRSGSDVVVQTVATKATVPRVVGLQTAAAVDALKQRGLAAKIVQGKQAGAAAGSVISQDPAADAQIARGSAVTIVAAAGPVVKGVPNVLGIAAPLAVRKLRSAGFGATVKSISSPKARGIVVAQDPAAGGKAKPGAAVALSVSKGPAAVAVPNVVGATASDAGAKLRAAGFVATVTTVPSTKPKETVVAQSPAAGQKAAKGSGVRINVSNGAPATTTATVASTAATTTATTATTSAATTSAATTSASTTTAATPPPASSTVTVPDVTGQNQTAAQRTLGRAGLRSTVAYVASSEAAGTVIAEKPADGTRVKRNTRIRLKVSTGPSPKATKPIPDVTSQDEASATQALENAGFVVQSIDEPVTDQSQDGTVVDEQPGGGTQAPSGSQVTIYVGRFSG